MAHAERSVLPLRVLFLGLPAGWSALALAAVRAAGHTVTAVVVPASAVPHLITDRRARLHRLAPPPATALSLTPAAASADLLAAAWEAGLPVLAADDFAHPNLLAGLAALAPDVACVACFTRKFPPAALELPPLGFLNVHPSLLPAYRGPSPLFWQFRDGAETGVTVHFMDAGLDTGDIAAQTAVPLPDGLAGPEAERRLMQTGAYLLRGVLDELARGTAVRRPQPPGGSYQGQPRDTDFALSTDWAARRAFNFMRGTADWGRPYRVTVDGRTLWLAAAEDYAPAAEDAPPLAHAGDTVTIRFSPGLLRARLARRPD